MKITLIKTINGEKIIQELEEIYGSLEGGVERLYERNPDNMKLYIDLMTGNITRIIRMKLLIKLRV